MYDDLIRLIERSNVAFPNIGNGVAEETVVRAEASLGLALPESFKWWLTNYGGGQIKGDVVYGLDEGDMGRPDIVDLARMNERDGLYDIRRLVFSIGNSETFFFDTIKYHGGEYEVVQHDFTQNEMIPYAVSFAEFLRKRICELYSLKDQGLRIK